MRIPQVGQKVAVRHRSDNNNSKPNLQRVKDIEVRTITGVYMGMNTIRDSVGECWEVALNDESHQHIAEWKTNR